MDKNCKSFKRVWKPVVNQVNHAHERKNGPKSMENNQSGLDSAEIPNELSFSTENTDNSSKHSVKSPESHQAEPFVASECPTEQTPPAMPSAGTPQPFVAEASGSQSNPKAAKGKFGSGSKQHKNSNSFSIFAEKNDDIKENHPLKSS